jgi:Domain of unknown function (DUF1707)
MQTQPQAPIRLASEDVIISAPMSYTGSAQRILRLRRRADAGAPLAAITVSAVVLVVAAWVLVTAWYLVWGIWLIPYRLLRRGARKRRVEAMRHRELMGTIQGSAAAIAGAVAPPQRRSPTELLADADRDHAIAELREHMIVGRITAEEFEERLVAAHRARTWGDLEAAQVDLPSG